MKTEKLNNSCCSKEKDTYCYDEHKTCEENKTGDSCPAHKNADKSKITSDFGWPVGSNEDVRTIGPSGPMTFDNPWFFEKLAHFDRERIPERVVHAKGAGAFGTFTVTHDITKYTKAKLFNQIGKKTDIFIRFSTVAGELGSADVERDPRGFAVKFYTEEGNWDLVGNNTPIFFIRDAIKFPDFIHSQKRDPITNLRSPNMQWDFFSHTPESIHQVTILMSDRGIPDGYRHMHGYGSHTFSMINDKNELVYVKFHFKTQQGIKNLTDEEAQKIAAIDRDSATRDLYDNIKNGNFPKWTLYIQVLTPEQVKQLPFHPFDVTKVWPHKYAPLIEVGEIELNKLPENFFTDVEQAAFNPANVVPGIWFSPDRMLQGRLFAYGDTQRYRLGANHNQIPVNMPRCPFASTSRGGYMNTFRDNTPINYEPNSYGMYHDDNSKLAPGVHVGTDEINTFNFRDYDDDYYSQPNALYMLMDEGEKDRLTSNMARSMHGVEKPILIRQFGILKKVNDDYGRRVATKLGMLDDYLKIK